MGKIFYDDVLDFAKSSSFFLEDIHRIPYILWGNLSGQEFCGVKSRCWGLAYVAVESQSTPSPLGPYPTLPLPYPGIWVLFWTILSPTGYNNKGRNGHGSK